MNLLSQLLVAEISEVIRAAALNGQDCDDSAAPPSSQPRRIVSVRLGKGLPMSGVRVLVGTRKGAFVLSSDGKREQWDVSGPHFPGWEIYHVKGSPADQDRLYASQSSGWFGQLIQRSDDGGATWEPAGNDFSYQGEAGTHQWYDGTPHPWEFARVWHLEPSLDDPDTVYAGVEDAGLFRSADGEKHWDVMRSDDAGESWHEVSGDLPTDFGFPIDVHAHEPETVYVVQITSDSHHFPPE